METDLLLEDFFIKLSISSHNWITGTVYPIIYYKEISTGKEGWCFREQNSEHETDDIENAQVMFEFSFCWRGVWEGRIYFKQEEYWSEELLEMSNLWNKIESVLKERIKQKDPHNYYED